MKRNKDYAVVARSPSTTRHHVHLRSPELRHAQHGRRHDRRRQRKFGGQEAMIVFEDVFVPYEHVFMDGECRVRADLVERFTAYHRRSYVCKTGLGDVIIGAAGAIADYNGVAKVSHIRDKLVEMTHLNETIYARRHRLVATKRPSAAGNYMQRRDARQRVQAQRHALPLRDRRASRRISRAASMVTLPSEQDFNHENRPDAREVS